MKRDQACCCWSLLWWQRSCNFLSLSLSLFLSSSSLQTLTLQAIFIISVVRQRETIWYLMTSCASLTLLIKLTSDDLISSYVIHFLNLSNFHGSRGLQLCNKGIWKSWRWRCWCWFLDSSNVCWRWCLLKMMSEDDCVHHWNEDKT